MKHWIGLLAVAVLAASLGSCAWPGSSPDSPGAYIQHVGVGGTMNYTENSAVGGRDVYFVFTNTKLTSATNSPPSVANITIDGRPLARSLPQYLPDRNASPSDDIASRVAAFNRNPNPWLRPGSPAPAPSRSISSQSATADAVGNTNTFYTDLDSYGNGISPVAATCKLVRRGCGHFLG
ncbi:MAG TPA: hypothetical protein VMV44_05435 [Rectinemataceae bacterium]|nr:hypothetical protein [Rectinemataceae bacterium]